MSEPPFRIRPGIRREWIGYRETLPSPERAAPRAAAAGACLPGLRLEVPHLPQARVCLSVPQCAVMALRFQGVAAHPEWLASLLRTDEGRGTPGGNLAWLRGWGVRAEFPRELQFYRDCAARLDARFAAGGARLAYRWEEPWLRFLAAALREGVPPILFVDLGRLYPAWRGLRQPHAVVLAGGSGRQAWIHDPARPSGPTRVGLSTLMNALLPGEPLAALLRAGRPRPAPTPGGGR